MTNEEIYDMRIMECAFELVYKWFGLRENGRLNLCNPCHVGALAVAREVVMHTSDYLSVKRPYKLQELSDRILEQARKYLRIHRDNDIDYRKPEHFRAVSLAASEIITFR